MYVCIYIYRSYENIVENDDPAFLITIFTMHDLWDLGAATRSSGTDATKVCGVLPT